MRWNINLYLTSRGDSPVALFIFGLDLTTKAKTAHLLNLLETYGPRLSMPHSRKMLHNLFELRIRGRIEIRIFYTFRADQIYLLHAFQKKGQKTPKHELELAKVRLTTLESK